MKMIKSSSRTGWPRLVTGITLGIILASAPVISAESIDPQADNILQSMSSYFGGTKAFSVNADIDFEVVATTGQKFQLSSFATVVMQRPSHVHIDRKGMVADFAFIYDGNTLTMQGKNLNIYTQYEGTGTVDDAIRVYEMETGLAAPGADLLLSDP